MFNIENKLKEKQHITKYIWIISTRHQQPDSKNACVFGHLGKCQILVIITSSPMDILVCILWWAFVHISIGSIQPNGVQSGCVNFLFCKHCMTLIVYILTNT